MDKLPVEILSKIIDHLAPREKVNLQSTSKKFFDLARDNTQWRLHCYEQSWAARQAARQAARSAARSSESLICDAPVSLTTLGQESLLDIIQPSAPPVNGDSDEEWSWFERARAAAEWDSSTEGEHVDWYSEYIARHGPICLSWVEQPSVRKSEGKRGQSYEAKGMGLLKDWSSASQNKIIAPLEDGSVCIWDLNNSHSADSRASKGKILGISEPGILMASLSGRRDHSPSKTSLEFINLGEGVSVDSLRQRAYLAVGNVLNEVDLETLKVISQQRYPWSIFALSQETDYSVPLTLATTLSLQIYDSRLSAVEEEEAISLRCEQVAGPYASRLGIFAHSDSPLRQLQSNGQSPTRIRSPEPLDKGANYAPLFQPGPLSILHPPAPHVNTILLAGRFPSILCYDRRYFPQLQTTVHSGGRLCSLASVPAPRFPVFSNSIYPESHSVVACGDYNGRGSLELYNLKSAPEKDHSPSNMTSTLNPEYKNRQSAASSKLLSVGSHGNRIVFSDAEGNIKWTERDGRSEVRRWNINNSKPYIPFGQGSQQPTPQTEEDQQPRGLWHSQSTGNNEVARKILPTGGDLTGDELLIWTGERIGRLRFSIPADYEMETDDKAVDEDDDVFMHAEVDEATREQMRHRRRDDWEKEQRYGDYMRRALERQADEVRWMGSQSFGL
ncbi:hypothetical protein DTO013E5_6385 [Penicillium roqueforti]|uniref:F-box domain, cyclin-like n=1 Tax=Penicillium roqueforti (strain FM164) TaxID=1365484 RepID=W6QPF5_PENRF|nr:hypothetical protein CBS147337_6910 [Penicillium roqueforti]CDM37876.1 F-box domain, cyclin-like [Penicillium roqueforti FM164]KAI2674198.1 hypothetical protein CBS147355_7373 [Penicillium roqueforti]KAI2682036.1 hypothetical protein LCP963914a_6451 [Penicillium roqueforti]KAI2699169.1 hypothetical protein CBS147372_6416 [Penicillium roqueforti]